MVVQGAASPGTDRGERFGQLCLSGREYPDVPRSGEAGIDDDGRGVFSNFRARPVRWYRGDPRGMAFMSRLAEKRVLLIISGGIAAFKAAELIRLLRRAGCGVTCVLTQNGARFVTALTLQALSEAKVYSELFSLTDENEMG